MIDPVEISRELLLIGGGHSHALVARLWGKNPLPGVRLTLVNPTATAAYSGMLPGFVAGHYRRDDLDIDLVRLARFAGARLIIGRAEAIDADKRTVRLSDGRRLNYHVLSLDIGVTSELPDLPGFDEFGVAAKPLDELAHKWTRFIGAVARGAAAPEAAVIGGGVAGVELAMAMAFALKKTGRAGVSVTLIERDRILTALTKSAAERLKRQLASCGVSVLENTRIARLTAGCVALQDGADIVAGFVVGAAGARPHGWLAATGLALSAGFVEVRETLQSGSAPEVFAVGDCAHMLSSPRPKAGVFAVRQAPVLHANLRAVLSGGALRKFSPQRDYLKLISLGEKSALALKWGFAVRGRSLWRLKHRIDRKFMHQFADLRPMTATRRAPAPLGASNPAPLCGGCGAKVGGVALNRVLAQIAPDGRRDVVAGVGDDAAVLRGPDGQTQVISTDHLRGFNLDPHVMARIAAVHALGDVWAMGATPQVALASVILPRLATGLQESWLAEIMAAAGAVFAAEGAQIVGGHSSLGAELSIGFTVTGLCAGAPLTLAGARPGDRIILSKPIGTGTILVGEMAMQARADWVLGALDSMARCQGKVAAVLGARARAMTDVTGFGLAGHLLGMARASGVSVRLKLDDVPLLPGAQELAARGVRSSIYADNRALLEGLDIPDTPRGALLCDPQTAGGFLAAVAAQDVVAILPKLNGLGFDAKVIARCEKGPVGLTLI